ncbi:MAG: glycoside hydrolase family 43 protein [Nakamurella sp.]
MGPRLAGVVVVLVAAAGCSAAATPAADSPSPVGISTAGPGATADAQPGPGEFVNPVVDVNFPDPGFLAVEGIFHLYGTEGEGLNVQTMTSNDLVSWTPGADALPQLGSWALPGRTWAPEVLAVDGGYVLFYTAADMTSGKQCIGRAEAADPGGPFVDAAAVPFVCQPDLGGSIDPNPITGPDGSRYLYWKNDGNCCGQPVHLWGQQIDSTAATLVGEPVPLLTNAQSWEGNLVEAPQMVTHDGRWVLFYAANTYSTDRYAEGWADCDGPLGPCTAAASPLLATNAAAAGPGHAYVFDHAGQTWILYHAWPPEAIGFVTPGRLLWLDAVTWTPDGPVVDGPNPQPQPVPAT